MYIAYLRGGLEREEALPHTDLAVHSREALFYTDIAALLEEALFYIGSAALVYAERFAEIPYQEIALLHTGLAACSEEALLHTGIAAPLEEALLHTLALRGGFEKEETLYVASGSRW